jgi:hypothetical protein
MAGMAGAPRAPGAKTYSPEYRNVEILPYSISADWECAAGTFRVGVHALDESMAFSLNTPSALGGGVGWRLSFHESTQLVPAETGDFLLGSRGMRRQWRQWEHSGGALLGGFRESPESGCPAPPGGDAECENNGGGAAGTAGKGRGAGDAEGAREGGYDAEGEHNGGGATGAAGRGKGSSAPARSADVFFRLGASHAFTVSRAPANSRISLDIPSLSPGALYVFALTPGISEEGCEEKNRRLAADFRRALDRQRRRYEAVRAGSPRLACQNPSLCAFMSLAPMYHESLKTPDAPGGLRAKTTRYWIWGFDSMMASTAAIYWGDSALIRDMLGFVERTSGDGARLAHAYTTANTPASEMTVAARGMYIAMLHHYYALTGDEAAVLRHYGFARSIMELMLDTSAGGGARGLMKGTSLFPDFPKFLKEDGNDISLFNNTLAYSALRAMETLSLVAGDSATAGRLQAFLAESRRSFAGIMFDPAAGMFANSADAGTRERRDAVNATGIVWENDFAGELVGGKDAPCMEFIERHCVSDAYIRAIPLWDSAFDGDANQLHCTWPVMDGYVVRLANRMGNAALLRKWAGWVSYWTDLLLCPEGVSYLVETACPDTDSWNCEPGTFQAYTMRRWYEDALHGYLGIVPDCGGISFSPAGTGDYRLENLYYRGLRCNITCAGEGRCVGSIQVGGETLTGTYKIPEAALIKNSRAAQPGACRTIDIAVSLRPEPWPLELRGCYNSRIEAFSHGGSELSLTVSGTGFSTILIYADGPCAVLLDGAPAAHARDPATGALRVAAVLKPGEPRRLEARRIH